MGLSSITLLTPPSRTFPDPLYSLPIPPHRPPRDQCGVASLPCVMSTMLIGTSSGAPARFLRPQPSLRAPAPTPAANSSRGRFLRSIPTPAPQRVPPQPKTRSHPPHPPRLYPPLTPATVALRNPPPRPLPRSPHPTRPRPRLQTRRRSKYTMCSDPCPCSHPRECTPHCSSRSCFCKYFRKCCATR